MLKRIISLTLVAVITVLGFSGCGKKAKQGHIEAPEDVWGAYNEKVVVNLSVPSSSAVEWYDDETGDYGYDDNVWTQSWLDEFNIEANILWDADDATEAYETKMNLAITNPEKDLPDIIVTSNYSQFMDLCEAGLVQPIQEYVENNKYEYMQECMAKHDLSSGMYDGELYGLPISSTDYRTREIFIRDDWMKQLNIPDPKTMDDVIAIGKKFVDAGLAKYALPLYKELDSMGDMQAVANSLGAFPKAWIEKDGKVVYGSVQQEMKQTLSIYADLYKGGYLDKAFSSLNADTLAAEITGDQIGVLPADYWILTLPLNNMWTSKRQVEWNIYPVLPSKSLTGDLKIQGGDFSGKMVCVNKDFNNPEVLMKLLNFNLAKLDDPELAETEVYHSETVDEKTYKYFQMNPLYVIFNDPMTNYNTATNVTAAIDAGYDKSKLVSAHDKVQYKNVKTWFDVKEVGNVPNSNAWVAYKQFYGTGSAFGIYNDYIKKDLCVFSVEQGYLTKTMKKKWSSLLLLEEKYWVDVITGKKAVNSFDDFVNDWNSQGGSDITKEMNEWFANKGK